MVELPVDPETREHVGDYDGLVNISVSEPYRVIYKTSCSLLSPFLSRQCPVFRIIDHHEAPSQALEPPHDPARDPTGAGPPSRLCVQGVPTAAFSYGRNMPVAELHLRTDALLP